MSKATIPQCLLQQYQRWHELEKKYRARRDAQRDQLIKLLGDGARVEDGDLDAHLQEYTQVTLSKAKVVESLGEERYAWLRAHVAPTVRTQLRVQERSKSKSHSHKLIKSKDAWMAEQHDDAWE